VPIKQGIPINQGNDTPFNRKAPVRAHLLFENEVSAFQHGGNYQLYAVFRDLAGQPAPGKSRLASLIIAGGGNRI
jgi:hypothetical protein